MSPLTGLVAVGLGAGAWLAHLLRALDTIAPAERVRGRVSVIVPARDEAATLPVLLGSLERLDAPPHEVLVVDDGSSDGTAAVAVEHGAVVVAAGALPQGWLGKPWACAVGARAATGTHLLFLDADTWLAPDALHRLLGAHEVYGGLVSVQPYHATVAAYEELSAYCNLVALLGSGAFAGARASRAAFGPCLLTSVADYHAVGGHAAVGLDVLDDLRLAQRYRDRGLPVHCFIGGDVIQYRMYPGGLPQLVDGWSKNLASGVREADRVAVVLTTLWLVAHVAVAARSVRDVTRAVRGAARVPASTIVAAVVTSFQLRSMLRRAGSFRLVTSLAFPIPLASFVAVFLRSAVLTFLCRRVVWRGRVIRLDRERT